MSYSWKTSLEIKAESLDCCEKLDCRVESWTERSSATTMAVTTVMLGLGSAIAVGRNSQYVNTWPGLKKQKSLRQIGRGSQTASSQTSRCGSGCALDCTLSAPSMFDRNLSGEEEVGDESTRTRWAEGVLGTASTEASNSR